MTLLALLCVVLAARAGYPVADASAAVTVSSGRGAVVATLSLYPLAGTTAQPAVYAIRLARSTGRWRVVGRGGGPRGCRPTRGGERDPDPGSTMLWC